MLLVIINGLSLWVAPQRSNSQNEFHAAKASIGGGVMSRISDSA